MTVGEARAAAKEARALAIPTTPDSLQPRVTLALARTETRKLLRHPALLGALPVALLMTGGGFVVSGPNSGSLLVGLVIALTAGSLLTSNLAALRSRRDGTEELFGSTPSSKELRTSAHLLSVLAAPCSIAVALGAGAFVLRLDGRLISSIEPTLPLQVILVVAAFGAFGVALARWIPSVLAAPVTIVAHFATPLIWLVPWVLIRESGFRMGWHFVYLIAVTAFFATVAFVRDRPTPARLVVAIGSLAITVVGAVLQFPPGGWL